jgi:hypothetical protein
MIPKYYVKDIYMIFSDDAFLVIRFYLIDANNK